MFRRFATSCWLPFVAALFFATGMIFLTDVPERDTLGRYAPMAEAFCRGDWWLVFHPRIPVFFPVWGGLFTFFTGGNGFLGCQMAAGMAFALTVFPLWGIFKRVFDRRIALCGTMLFSLCSYWLRFASSGGRDSSKMFFFITAVYGIVCIWQERKNTGNYIIAGTAAAAMALVRDDSLLIALCIGMVVLCFETVGTKRFPWRTLTAATAGFAVMLPLLFVNYIFTGYPVPSSRFLPYAKKIMPAWSLGELQTDIVMAGVTREEKMENSAGDAGNGTSEAAGSQVFVDDYTWGALPEEVLPEHITLPPWAPERIMDFGLSVVKGAYYFFALPALLLCLWWIRCGKWTAEQSILLAAFAGHTLLIIFQILISDSYLYVSRRYLIAAAPLLMGWAGAAVLIVKDLLYRRIPGRYAKPLWVICCTVVMLGLLYDAATPQLKKRYRPRHAFDRKTVLLWSDAIRQDYNGPAERGSRVMRMEYYMSFRRPVVVGDFLPELGYLAGGEGFCTTYDDALARGLIPDYMVMVHPAGAANSPEIPSGYRVWQESGDKRGKVFLLKNEVLQ